MIARALFYGFALFAFHAGGAFAQSPEVAREAMPGLESDVVAILEGTLCDGPTARDWAPLGAGVVESLIAVAQGEIGSRRCRVRAVHALRAFDDPRLPAVLLSLAGDVTLRPRLRVAALETLAVHDQVAALAPFLAALADPDPYARSLVARALADDLLAIEVEPALEARLGVETDPGVRRALAAALSVHCRCQSRQVTAALQIEIKEVPMAAAGSRIWIVTLRRDDVPQPLGRPVSGSVDLQVNVSAPDWQQVLQGREPTMISLAPGEEHSLTVQALTPPEPRVLSLQLQVTEVGYPTSKRVLAVGR